MGVYDTLAERVSKNEAEISRLKSEVQGLQRWQDRQNGTLDRLDAKVDTQFRWMVGIAATSMLNLIGILIAAVSLVRVS